MKLFSLFTGIGGPEKALKRLGIQYELVGFSEIDKYAIKSYCAIFNVSETLNYGDITQIKEEELPDFDLMTWGFPCQDISIAGKQAGIREGTRSGLYYDGLRILREKKPKYSLIENVKALTSKKFTTEFEQILRDLESCGYNNYWQVLNAKHYGIPQNRERVFIVSIRKDINQQFIFPQKKELKLKLKDLLDNEVDEKYYLSDKAIKTFTDMTNRNGYIRGKRFNPYDIDEKDTAYTIKTTSGSRPEDNFIKVKEPRFYNQAFKTAYNSECDNGDTIDAFNNKVNKSGISPTVTTRPEGFKTAILIPEKTKKGYAIATDGDGIYINRPWQKRGVVQKEKIQTIKTSANDLGVVTLGTYRPNSHCGGKIVDTVGIAPTFMENHGNITAVVEPKIIYEKPLENKGWHHKANEVLNINGISTCIHTQSNNLLQKIKSEELRIRKLTPIECWRLMGFDDDDFSKAQATGNSNTQLYKQAGNSIVVNVLEAIFENLLKGE